MQMPLAIAQQNDCAPVLVEKLRELEAADSLAAYIAYFDCLILGDPVKARTELQQFVSRKDVQASPLYLLETRFRIATVYSSLADLDKAILAFDTLYTLAAANKDYYRMSLAKVNQGITYRRMSQFGKSMEAYDMAMQAAKIGDAKPLEASILMNRGSLLNHMENYHEALVNLRESYRLHDALASDRGKAMVAANMGISLKRLGQTDSAIYFYESSAASFKASGDNYNLAKMYSNIGQLYAATDEDSKAHTYLNRAIEMMEQQDNLIDLVNTLNAKAQLYLERGDFMRAVSFAQRGAQLAEEQDYWLGARNALEYVAKAAAGAGDHKKAYEAQEKGRIYHDSIFSGEQQQLVAEMQAKFDFEKKELELHTKDELLETERAKIRYGYFVLGLLLLLLVVLLFYSMSIQKLNRRLAAQRTALSEKNDELQQMDAFKNRLLSIISHDIRNPLSGLKSILSLQASGAITEAELQQWNVDVTKRIDLALGMLENLLDWSKAQLIGQRPIREALEADLFVQDVVEHLQFQAAQKEITIKWQVEPGVKLFADRHMLHVCLYNVMSNALKFSNRKDTVEVFLRNKDDEVVLVIRDQGVGMAPEQLVKALNPEEGFSTFGTENEKGTGLGLILTHKFLNLMGGRLEVESEAGNGSEFRMCFPV